MVKMRIPIREQLGCLVLFASLIGLAVVAIATWVTNHSFVLSLRATRLTLTASLKSAQIASNLLLMQSTVKGTATRVLIQLALQRYNNGNDTSQNWSRSLDDLQAVFQGDQSATLLIQAQIYAANNSDYSVLNSTAPRFAGLELPFLIDGKPAQLGVDFVPDLYPKFTPIKTRFNNTSNQYTATFNGRTIDKDHYLVLGPYRVNNTLNLMSITMPIINNTSAIDTLGWLTAVMDASLVTDIVDATEGLDDSGVTMVFGPNNSTNKFADGVLYNSNVQDPADNESIRFLTAPTNNGENLKERHGEFNNSGTFPSPFGWNKFPAVKRGYSQIIGPANTTSGDTAGSIISTKNEMGHTVAVGFAFIKNPFVDWLLVVEQSHSEVWGPIYHLRNIIIGCVFGTMGGMLLLAFPVAHYLSRPIRRLRDATRKSVAPPGYDDDSLGSQHDGADDYQAAIARKEGFFGTMKKFGRGPKKSRLERREEERRRQFRIPGKVKDRKHFIHDELTDLTTTFNEMTDELMMQYEKLEERVQQRTAELEQSKKAAEAANESKTLFIANISHELKTPLNGILGMCAVCMSEDDPVKMRRSLGIIYKSGDLLLNLLTDLLTFSKNQVGQQLVIDEKEFRLREISTQVLAIFERQAKESGIALKVKFEGTYESNLDESGRPNEHGDLAPFGLGRLKDMILYGDQHRILQVVINLVSNSLKFTPKGGTVVMTIRCVGEASGTNSRKVSLQSRQSSIKNSKNRVRGGSSEAGSITVANPKTYDTATSINAYDKANAYAHVYASERSPTPPPGQWLTFEFEVEDTGPGIPEHLHAKIFEPFVQGDLGLSKKYGGTGLGLSICSQLAGLMKGTIQLKSEEGHGSVFTMHIPLKHITSRADSTASSSKVNLGDTSAKQSLEGRDRPAINDDALSGRSVQSAQSNTVTANAAPGPVAFDTDAKPRLVGLSHPFFATNPPLESPNSQSAAMERVTAEATQRGDKVKVLVAEDNKTNQEVVLRMLKLEDVYDVTVAKDGQEALDKVKESMERQDPYNLIFMDIQMPNLDGLQSTRLIRQSGFSAPIVALTAYSEESNIRQCYDSGMDFFLSKPIRRPALKHVLKTYCPPIPEEESEATTPPATVDPSSSKPTSNGKTKDPQAAVSAVSSGVNTSNGAAPFTIVARTNPRDDDTPDTSPLS
ncbi:putative histidine kinase HHK5p [Clohesyomyces aquaticus]|uniref:histidine kinase n=1 Tax=Clohesyomyces aquaticus TaxID=1231657 RepID=A0A1Y1ZWR4_9PLEO|nr:putative histidine kinase HHK5p [Clohesyomyces aquaticus]